MGTLRTWNFKGKVKVFSCFLRRNHSHLRLKWCLADEWRVFQDRQMKTDGGSWEEAVFTLLNAARTIRKSNVPKQMQLSNLSARTRLISINLTPVELQMTSEDLWGQTWLVMNTGAVPRLATRQRAQNAAKLHSPAFGSGAKTTVFTAGCKLFVL